jgi:hypothetical protein
MAADDVTSLAPRVDGVIFVARTSLDMLYQRKARVLGLVFNSVRPSAGGLLLLLPLSGLFYYSAHPGK